MIAKHTVVLILCATILAGCSKNNKEDITFSTMLSDMTNISVFAKTPLGTAEMISSYDRKGGNQDWANFASAKDGGFFILANLEGPGVIRRIWYTSFPQPCQWLFYFDGEQKPSLILNNSDMFNGTPPFCCPIATAENGVLVNQV